MVHKNTLFILPLMEETIISLSMSHTKALSQCVMKPTHKNIEKIDQCLRNKPLRGDNLLYITQMNNC